MTEQMKLNGVEEQLTENQRAVQAKLKKVIKKVGGIPREIAETTIGMALCLAAMSFTSNGTRQTERTTIMQTVLIRFTSLSVGCLHTGRS